MVTQTAQGSVCMHRRRKKTRGKNRKACLDAWLDGMTERKNNTTARRSDAAAAVITPTTLAEL